MHHDSQPDSSAKTAPANTALPATQVPRDDTLPNQADVEVEQPIASGEAVERQGPGGVVKLDEHGVVLRFVPLHE